MGSKRFSISAVLLSIVGALLAFGVGEGILSIGCEWPAYLKLGVYFGVGAMLVAAMVLISQKLSPQLIGYRWQQQYFKTSLKLFIPTTFLLVGIVAGLFQFLYAMEISGGSNTTDILIAIDNSGSMEQTDADGERFKATSSLIDNLSGNKRVALMTFDDDPKLIIDFTPVKTKQQKELLKSQIGTLSVKPDGLTEVQKMMDEAYRLIAEQDNKHSARLIIISDGNPTDGSAADIPSLVKDFVADKITIHTIGMMYLDPTLEAYLIEIANLTGGQHFSTSDTTMLADAFGRIKYDDGMRELLSTRSGEKAEAGLYVVLRIIFLGVLALLIALGLGIMFDNRFLARGMMIGGSFGGLIGGILVECLFKGETAPWLIRGGYWLLVGISLLAFTGLVTFKDNYHGTREA